MSQLDRNSDPEIDAILQAERNKYWAGGAYILIGLLLLGGAFMLFVVYILANIHGGWI